LTPRKNVKIARTEGYGSCVMSKREAIFALVDELVAALLVVIVLVLFLERVNVISLHSALMLSATIVAGFTIVGYLAAKEQLKRPQAGVEALIGKFGKAIDELNPSGIVVVNGEYWSATSIKNKSIKRGAKVVVKGVKGLTLLVDEVEEQKA